MMSESQYTISITPAVRNFAGQFAVTASITGAISFFFLGIVQRIGFLLPGGTIMASMAISAALVLFMSAILFPIAEDLFTQVLLINSNEIVYRKGILSKKQVIMPRHFIFSVEITQTLYQSAVGTADITMLSGGYSFVQFKGIFLKDAEKIKTEVSFASGCITEKNKRGDD